MTAETMPHTVSQEEGLVVPMPGQQELDFAEQLANSQVPATETVVANPAEYVGRHSAAEEAESRNPDRLMVRVAGRIAKLSEKLQGTADRRTLGQAVGESTINAGVYTNEQITKGRNFAGKLGKNLLGKFAAGREAAAKGYEKSAKVSKKVGKGALIAAGLTVALPTAAVGAGLYFGGKKGAELGARAGRALAEDAKGIVNETSSNYHEARAEASRLKVAKLEARLARKQARAAKHQSKVTQ